MIEFVDTYQLDIMALELLIDRDQLDEGRVRSIEQLDVAFQSRFYVFIGKQQEVIRGHELQDTDPK